MGQARCRQMPHRPSGQFSRRLNFSQALRLCCCRGVRISVLPIDREHCHDCPDTTAIGTHPTQSDRSCRECPAAFMKALLRRKIRGRLAQSFLHEQLQLAAASPETCRKIPTTWHALGRRALRRCCPSVRRLSATAQGRWARGNFSASKAQALYFLQAVAPTKLVDGAWLYGLLTALARSAFRAA